MSRDAADDSLNRWQRRPTSALAPMVAPAAVLVGFFSGSRLWSPLRLEAATAGGATDGALSVLAGSGWR